MQVNLKREVQRYVSQFGDVELRNIIGTPYYSCNLNKVPTVIFPNVILANSESGSKNFEPFISELKNSHQIIRLDVIQDQMGNTVEIKSIYLNNYTG